MKWIVQPRGHVLSLQHLWHSMAGTCLTLRVPEQFLGINFRLLIIHWVFNHEPFISWKDLQIAYPRSVMWNSPSVRWCICGWTRSQILNSGPPSQCSSWNICYFYKVIFKVRHSISAQSFNLLSLCHQHPGYYNRICIYINIIACINNSSTFPLRCVLLWGASSSLLTRPLTSTYWTSSIILFGLKTHLACPWSMRQFAGSWDYEVNKTVSAHVENPRRRPRQAHWYEQRHGGAWRWAAFNQVTLKTTECLREDSSVNSCYRHLWVPAMSQAQC